MDATQEEKVIITINGKKYDVTQWRHKHPGRDLYVNGTDMTKAFMAQHGHDFSRLQPFEVKEDATAVNPDADVSEVKALENTTRTESSQIIDRSDDAVDIPKPYSMKDLDKALKEELEDI